MNTILKGLLLALGAFLALQWGGGGGGTRERSVADALAPDNQVVMYSLTTCGYCKQKRDQLTRAGIPFHEYFVDTDNARMRELSELLSKRGVPPGGIGTPTLLVNGELLLNNPSMDTIRKHLRYKAG